MEWPTDRGLQFRMVATLVLTAVVAAAGAATAYAGVRLLLWVLVAFFEFDASAGSARAASLVVTAAFLLGVTASELWLGRAVGLPEVDAHAAGREFHPGLAGHVDRVAQQLDLSRPTVALTEDPVPLAMTTGLTPASTTLVVSTGLLEALDDDELEAVVAHELAHVRNRDAAVMTLASLPMVVADAIRQWAIPDPKDDEDADGFVYQWETVEEDDGEPVPSYQLAVEPRDYSTGYYADEADAGNVLSGLVYVVAAPFWVLGRLLVSLLSRYRELAADRAAAAITGSPAAVASALRTLSETDRPPRQGGRSGHAVDALAIVPEDPPEPVTLGPDGEREPTLVNLGRRLFRTHPTLERRLDVLGELETDIEMR